LEIVYIIKSIKNICRKDKNMKRVVGLLIVLLILADICTAATIYAKDAKSVDRSGGKYSVLNYLSIMWPVRVTVLEFDISGISLIDPQVTLNIWFENTIIQTYQTVLWMFTPILVMVLLRQMILMLEHCLQVLPL
jgi:hypothetical protein